MDISNLPFDGDATGDNRIGCVTDGRVGVVNDVASGIVTAAMADGDEGAREGGTGDNNGDCNSTGTVPDTRRLHRGLRIFTGTVGCCSKINYQH